MRASLPAAVRAQLDRTAVPTEDGYPVEACVTMVDGCWRTAWMHQGGRHKAAFGGPFTSGTAAAAASRYLNERTFGPAST